MVNILYGKTFFLYALLGLVYPAMGFWLTPAWAGFFKILPILMLMRTVATTPDISRIKPLLLLALLAAIIGDLMLLEDHKTAIELGMLAFACAHLINIGILWPQWRFRKGMLLKMLFVTSPALLGFWLLLPNMQELTIPSLGYLSLLLVLVWCSLGIKTEKNYLIVGSLLFLCSDNLLGLELFYWPESKLYIAVMLSYYLAQWFLYFGLMQTERAKRYAQPSKPQSAL